MEITRENYYDDDSKHRDNKFNVMWGQFSCFGYVCVLCK